MDETDLQGNVNSLEKNQKRKRILDDKGNTIESPLLILLYLY